MKAAVIEEIGSNPVVQGAPDPESGGGFEVAAVSSAALNPIDQHFASGRYGGAPVPHVVGREGIATLADGRRVYFAAQPFPQGAVAERAAVKPAAAFDLPEGIDDGQALAIGAAGLAASAHPHLPGGPRRGRERAGPRRQRRGRPDRDAGGEALGCGAGSRRRPRHRRRRGGRSRRRGRFPGR